MERKEGIKMDAISKDILLRRLYETFYGIHNHYSGKTKPLDLITARQKEEVYQYSKKVRDMERFIDLGVYAATGLSMESFFELPAADAEYIFQLVARRNKSEGHQAGALEAQLKKYMEGSGKDKA